MATQENEPKPRAEEGVVGVKEIPQAPEIPPHIEKAGVQAVSPQTAQVVTDDSGNIVVEDPLEKTDTVVVSVPKSREELEALSKGPVENSITWYALAWLRAIKKALHFGWKLVFGGGDK